jgi:hypothetical protein
MLDAASGLLVPDWLLSKWPGIAALARTLYAEAIVQPPGSAEAVRRLANSRLAFSTLLTGMGGLPNLSIPFAAA